MKQIADRNAISNQRKRVVGLVLLAGSLALLAGCQGLSGGGSSNPPPSSTLSLTAGYLSFGSVAAGETKTLQVTALNSGTASITVSSVTISSKYFSLSAPNLPATIGVGETANLTVVFSPNAAGNFNATASITSNATNTATSLSLMGTGTGTTQQGALTSNPATEDFPSVTVGSNEPETITLTNTGTASVDITQASISGTGFQLSGITPPLTLDTNQSKTFTVTFAPQAVGSTSGTVTITSDGANPSLTIGLSGTATAAVGQLAASPTTIPVGNVVVGTSGTASGTLMASGANVTVTAAAANNAAFTLTGLSLPVTIPAGNSVPFTVTFDPQATGAASATLTFTSNAQTSSVSATATGTGTPAPTYSVNLSWTESTSPNISGYNIYRAPYASSCGSFAKINPTLNTATLYTDTVVKDGSSYCYATTAVNTSSEESGYSNVVSNVQIPAP
jgi:hypothetical protein